MAFIELRQIEKVYRTGKLEFNALRGVDLDIDEGELTAIVGPSGSGKSTLLNMITGIDRPTTGSVEVAGTKIERMKEDRLARFRGERMGIIFQFFQLFPTLTALENALIPMDFARRGNRSYRRNQAEENLKMVGLGDKLRNLPSELSGGEQQRVAIARALANDPQLIIGDEPTGNLDSRTEGKVFDLLMELNDAGKTIVFVTHSPSLAARARRVITIRDGLVENN